MSSMCICMVRYQLEGHGLILNWKITVSAKVAGQQVPRICPSPHPSCSLRWLLGVQYGSYANTASALSH